MMIDLLNKELEYFLRNKMAMLMLFGVPLILALFFGGLYSHHKVTEVKVAVIDEDNTSLSRSLAENLNRSEKFNLVEYLHDRNQIGDYLEANKVDAVFLIPANFTKDIKRSIPVEVGTFVDGTNMLISNTVLSGANEVIQTTQAGVLIKILEGMGVSPARSKNLVQLVQFRNRVWYNPTFNYANFLVLGLIGAVIQQITLFQTAQAFIRDKIDGKVASYKNAGMSYIKYYSAKVMFYFSASVFNLMLTLAIVKSLFGIPIRGQAIEIFVLIVIFSASVVNLGFLFSLLAKTEMSANQYAMIISSPAFLISGFTWPLFAMPLFFQWIGKAIPLTHFLLALRALALRGANIRAIYNDLTVLFIMSIVFTVVSLVILKKQWYTTSQKAGKGSSYECSSI